MGWDGTRDNEGLASSFFGRGTEDWKGDGPLDTRGACPSLRLRALRATNHWQTPSEKAVTVRNRR